ncbi:MAG: endonuclease MutS2, partial [Bryobacteraceae bacterium]
MKRTSGDILEFDALRELVGRYVSSPFGRARLADVEPHGDRARAEADLAEAEEATHHLRAASQPGAGVPRISFRELPDITQACHKLRMQGGVLDAAEVAEVLTVLDRAADIKSNLTAVTGRFPLLGRRGLAMGEFRDVLRDLSGKILPNGTLADHASVALGRLRREIERQRKAIQDSLERFLKSHSDEGVLQDELVTIRNDRFVVPIISGQRKRIEGVIHGASSSGHTLFIEPLETIDLNNDLVRLTEDEQRECHRIVREMTERLRQHAEPIQRTLDTLADLELIFAKGRFAVEFDCVRPRFSEDGAARLSLRDARHPLLEDVLKRKQKRVVPFSLELDRERRTLIISGPNTGGKTVTLKTAGLLTLMAHAGLPVPAAEAEFPVFEQVLADIGDNQSIQESLSTFSAHIGNIREMLLDATSDSLVLMDELGAATDPEEGGALGVAVVGHFRSVGAFTLASTHLLPLKLFGANTPGVINASMGFDETTLEPTYRLAVGLPGKSAGLDIAMRLGVPPYIMEQARAAMSTRERDLARFLAELHEKLASVTAAEAEAKRLQQELVERERSLKQEWQKKETAKLKELEQRVEQVLAKFEADSQATMEKIRESAESRKAADHAQRQVARVRRELREEFQSTVVASAAGVPAPVLKIEEGARVRLKGVRDPARVRRKLSPEKIEVEAGFLKMQVSIDDVIEVLPEGGGETRLPKNVSFRPAPQFAPLVQELNVIGKRAEEACDEVDRFLDNAVMATASRVRIIHGHGMG